MAFGLVIGAVAGAAIGGAVQGVTAFVTTKEKAGAYRQAAQQVRDATEKYSGKNAYDSMVNKGQDYMTQDMASMGTEMAANTYQPTNPGAGASAQANALNAADRSANVVNATGLNALQSGMSDANAANQAKYNAATTQAQQLMNQADINFNVANQAVQEGLGAAGNIAQTANSLRRTKNGREID